MFTQKSHMSKKAKRELNTSRRTTWTVKPTTRRIESAKAYNRKKARTLYHDPGSFSSTDFFSPTNIPNALTQKTLTLL